MDSSFAVEAVISMMWYWGEALHQCITQTIGAF